MPKHESKICNHINMGSAVQLVQCNSNIRLGVLCVVFFATFAVKLDSLNLTHNLHY